MLIFIAIIFIVINYLSGSKADIGLPVPNILGVTYQYLPESSRQTLENINTTSTAIYIQDKINYLKTQAGDFPQKQITELKKLVVQTIYQNIMNTIETKK